MLKPTDDDLKKFHTLEGLVLSKKPCPNNFHIHRLVKMQMIRAERYLHHLDKTSKSCRIVWLLTGDHAGKHTAKPGWFTDQHKRVDVFDARPHDMREKLDLIALNHDVVTDKKKSVSLHKKPPWE